MNKNIKTRTIDLSKAQKSSNLEEITDFEIVQKSLEKIRKKIGISDSLVLLPYIMSIEYIDDEYYMAITKWEFENRLHTRDVQNDPMKAYRLFESGLVIPEINTKRIYGQIIGTKPHESSLLANRIINVLNNHYGNYSRSFRLQLEPISPYRVKVPSELSSKIRRGSSINLVTLLPSILEQKANEYN